MPTICRFKPNRSKPRTYTERDVGRIIAHAREDGADDTLLLAYILAALGLRRLGCIMFELMNVLSRAFFVSALLSGLTGVITIAKALKILLTGRRSTIPGIIELLVPRRWLSSYAAFLLTLGSVITIAAGAIAFLTTLAQNLQLFLVMRGVCRTEFAPVRPSVAPIEIGSILDDLQRFVDAVKQADSEVGE